MDRSTGERVRFGIRDLLQFVTLFSLCLGNILAIRSHWPSVSAFNPFDALVAMIVGIGAIVVAATWNVRRFLGPVIYRTGTVWPMSRYLALAIVSCLVSVVFLSFGNRNGLGVATVTFLLCLGWAVVRLMQPDAQLREKGLTVEGGFWKWEELRYQILHFEGEDRSVFQIVEPWYRQRRGRTTRFKVTPEHYERVLAIFDAKGAEEVRPAS